MLRIAPLILAAATLTGCVSTLAELRESPPLRTAVVPARSAPELAACAMDGLEIKAPALGYRLLTVGPSSYVTGSIYGVPFRPTSIPFFEAALTDISPGQTQIQTRVGAGIGPVGSDAERAFWPILARCAGGAALVVVPPLGG